MKSQKKQLREAMQDKNNADAALFDERNRYAQTTMRLIQANDQLLTMQRRIEALETKQAVDARIAYELPRTVRQLQDLLLQAGWWNQ